MIETINKKNILSKLVIIIKMYKNFLPILIKNKKINVILAITLTTAQAFIPIIQIFVTKQVVNNATILFTNWEFDLFLILKIIIYQAAINVATNILNTLQKINNLTLQQYTNYFYEKSIIEKVSILPLSYIENNDYYNKLQRISTGIGIKSLNMVNSLFSLIQQIVILVGYLIIILSYHWLLIFGLISIIIPTFITSLKFGERRLLQVYQQTPLARKALYIVNLLKGREAAKELRIFNHVNYLFNKWNELFLTNAKQQFKLEKSIEVSSLKLNFLNIISFILSTFFLIYSGINKKITIGDYFALSQTFSLSQSSLNVLITTFSRIYEDSLFLEDLYSFLDIDESTIKAEKAAHFPENLQYGIQVKNLYFKYNEKSSYILEDVSFNVVPGEKIAIVGENGAGKSSLVKCLLGLYIPTKGSILFDNVSIQDINEEQFKKNLSVMFQDFVCYHLTVRENIALSDLDNLYNDDLLTLTAKKSTAMNFIDNLEEKFDTEIGWQFHKSHELSGGQWQKIALSRAFFREAQIYIFDEPTSSLDPLTEASLYNEIIKKIEKKTSIFITHRLGSCLSMDRILVLKEGRIVENGNHNELMKLQGEYYKMFTSQAKWYTSK